MSTPDLVIALVEDNDGRTCPIPEPTAKAFQGDAMSQCVLRRLQSPELGRDPLPLTKGSLEYAPLGMPNERSTESIVRDHLRDKGVEGQVVEEQTSDNARVRSALARASKAGDGVGKPEFIVRVPDEIDTVIVVECKADTAHHVSPGRDKPKDFAVDGVLHYASEMSRSFDVIAIAVSGTSKDSLKVSTFRWLKKTPKPDVLEGPAGPITSLVRVEDYFHFLKFDPDVRARSFDELMAFSRELHDYMRDQAKLSENEKPLVVSGILLALRDDVFASSWEKYKVGTLGRELRSAIRREAEAAFLDAGKQRVMLQPYSFIDTHPELNRVDDAGDWPLRILITDIEEHVRPFINRYHDVDVLGQFYGEFLRYAGGDKKGLGIVLTPRHLTELFTSLADVKPTDTVIDTCCGTGGFLIAAMAAMDRQVGADQVARMDIREHRLIGVEQLPQMFALVVSNMILRGDGKANLYRESCFDKKIFEALKAGETGRYERPTVGLINPPFSQKGENQHELDFVLNLLNVLAPGGRAVVVLPMSCAIESHPLKERILEQHSLIAAMSLPNDLFSPVGVVPIAFAFEAHHPHANNRKKTWLALWKDDGFVKAKKKGRIDANGRWAGIRTGWIDAYDSRREDIGVSVVKDIGADDEWCAEAHLETDYSKLSVDDVEAAVREYAVYSLLYRVDGGEAPHGSREEDDDNEF